MKLNRIKNTLIILLASSIFFISCSGPKNVESDENEHASKEGEEDPLKLTKEQMQAVGIVTGKIEYKNLNEVVRVSGQLAVPPQNKADVSVLSGGIIRRVNVIEGQQVRQGQVLALIENQDLIKLQQDYLAAKHNFTYVEAEYRRQKELQDGGAGTGKFYQSAAATYNAEHMRLKAYESQLKQLGIVVTKVASGSIVTQFPVVSPINGTVGQISANTGSFVVSGVSIMKVVDNSKIHCDLTVFEKDLMRVKVGQKVNFQLTNQENQKIEGTINGINKSFQNESKGVIVHAVINNASQKNLIPGMYVTALIDVGDKLAPAVPVEALVRSQGKQYLYAVDEEYSTEDTLHFSKVEIGTGVSELGYVEIKPLKHLPEKIRIVLKGAFYLQSKSEGADEHH